MYFMKIEDIARVEGITRQYVNQLLKKAIYKIRRELRKRGINTSNG